MTLLEPEVKKLLNLVGRKKLLFQNDIKQFSIHLDKIIACSKFLVIGGAGSIGQAVVKEIFKRNPKKLHVVDLSENNLTELVRDIRSSFGYIQGKFNTFALDVSSIEYDAFIKSDGKYDYVLNLSAMKHVRSEKDIFTLIRMIDTNIFNTEKTIKQSIKNGVKKYFCISTDKASNPVNMMGASKLIMEMFCMRRSSEIEVSTARFANVAFSEGSLLQSFSYRFEKKQPIAAPNDVKRYFLTPQESGELCLMSCILGQNRDIFFPKLNEEMHLKCFSEIASGFLRQKGFETYECESEEQARELIKTLPEKGKWPCVFTTSNTTGEKEIEEFFTKDETLEMDKFYDVGVIKNTIIPDEKKLMDFEKFMIEFKSNENWDKKLVVKEFFKLIPNFVYNDKGIYLDRKM